MQTLSNNSNKVSNIIASNFELEAIPFISKADLIMALQTKIEYMLRYETEALFSKLYRLDVFENKIKMVMETQTNVAYGLAVLVVERLEEKEISRKQNPAKHPDDKDLDW